MITEEYFVRVLGQECFNNFNQELENYGGSINPAEYLRLSDIINTAFSWDYSHMGYDYWHQKHDYAVYFEERLAPVDVPPKPRNRFKPVPLGYRMIKKLEVT